MKFTGMVISLPLLKNFMNEAVYFPKIYLIFYQGITTYEYVVAMRAQPEGPLVEDEVTSSTSNSTVPDMSRTSSLELPIPRSLGLQQQGGWCTSPRIFVERQVNGLLKVCSLKLPCLGLLVEMMLFTRTF